MNRVKLLSTVALSSLAFANSSLAADVSSPAYDWTGFYIGGTVGWASTNTASSLNYTNDGGNPAVGWVDGRFHGDVYNTLDSLNLSADAPPPTNNSLPALTQWVSSLSGNDGAFSGTALLGYTYQSGSLVLGGELRASFGDFGASDSDSWSDVGTTNGFVTTNESVNFAYEDYGGVLQPWNIGTKSFPASGSDYSYAYGATYHQDTSIEAGTEYNAMISPVARLGYAIDRVQLFVMGGPSYANVEASTSAVVKEYTSDATTVLAGTQTGFSAEKTYSFSGSNSENRWGYTIGGGADWAVTDRVAIRLEGEFHDLGSVSVTGKSADTDATYEVKQDLSGYSLSTGVSFRF
jgi:opacity protein-like surface antigen